MTISCIQHPKSITPLGRDSHHYLTPLKRKTFRVIIRWVNLLDLRGHTVPPPLSKSVTTLNITY